MKKVILILITAISVIGAAVAGGIALKNGTRKMDKKFGSLHCI